MVADNAKTLKLQYLSEALQWHHVPSRHIQALQHAGRPSRSRKATRRSTVKSTTKSTAKSRMPAPPVESLNPPATVDYSASTTVAIESSQQSSSLPPSLTPSRTNPELPQNHGDTSLAQPMPVEATEHHVDANV
ncbi:MAG: hypothetical protein F6K30_21545, partial [Cyanothece sp. SIO2G6]|nr:hypothetical protein [Cyanothece sp. SIO2G6]